MNVYKKICLSPIKLADLLVKVVKMKGVDMGIDIEDWSEDLDSELLDYVLEEFDQGAL